MKCFYTSGIHIDYEVGGEKRGFYEGSVFSGIQLKDQKGNIVNSRKERFKN
jgi:hypothetical protein